ncbi:IclR family transcriptional regulator [Actinomadura roseirufa]|uniref:IclR family transcriptional regulator n=1 Tax=Actinomadura roseirufa TaxID=2094049 RepID=UPI001041A752|nr:IclR family transcriptional regulator [Actinomadura roseirufa]
MAGNSGEPGRTVASKIFAVLDTFGDAGETLRLTDIAQRSGLPLPTAHRMVGELVAWGGLERSEDGSYRIGQHMWAIGSVSPCMRRLRELGHPHLQELAAATNANAQLAVLDGTDALFLDRVHGHGTPLIHTRVGGRLPLHATAVGKVLLAHAPAAVRRDVVEGRLARFTPYTVQSPGRLARELDDVRTRGVASSREELQQGVVSVAAPVVHPDQGVIAALGAVAASTVQEARLVRAVRAAAAAMERDVAADERTRQWANDGAAPAAAPGPRALPPPT